MTDPNQIDYQNLIKLTSYETPLNMGLDPHEINYVRLMQNVGHRNGVYGSGNLIKELRKLYCGKTLDYPKDMKGLLNFIGAVEIILIDLGFSSSKTTNQGFAELSRSTQLKIVQESKPVMRLPKDGRGYDPDSDVRSR